MPIQLPSKAQLLALAAALSAHTATLQQLTDVALYLGASTKGTLLNLATVARIQNRLRHALATTQDMDDAAAIIIARANQMP